MDSKLSEVLLMGGSVYLGDGGGGEGEVRGRAHENHLHIISKRRGGGRCFAGD